MVRRDPDDIITALSKNLKKQNPQIMRFTLKRACPHFATKAKAHSRIAKRNLKRAAREQANQNPDEVWPLYIRYKQSVEGKQTSQNKDERIRLNCPINKSKGNDFVGSLLRAFRGSFYRKQEEDDKKQKKGPTPVDLNSKSSKRKAAKNIQNRERRHTRKQIAKDKKIEKRAQKQRQEKQKNQPTNQMEQQTAN